MSLPHLERIFPNLARAGYDKTSNETGRPPQAGAYNCIAWAAEDTNHWWWPDADAYWPFWIKKEVTVSCFVRTFRWLGYLECISSRKEFGFEKVALYAIHVSRQPMQSPASWRQMSDWIPKHMARQLRDGTWTSKIGEKEDIAHYTLDAVEAYGPPYMIAEYGGPVVYMKRFIPMGWIIRLVQRVVAKRA